MLDAERLVRMERLYLRVLDSPPERRTAVLEESCSDDPDLLHELESLLEAREEAGSFLSPEQLCSHIGKLGSEAAAAAVGSALGPYRIVAEIGSGAMGEVYRARDSRLERDLALKVLPSAFTNDAERVARFQREAKAASGLNHPNIVTIYEIGQADKTWFIAEELIAGITLRQRLSSGKLPVQEVIEIGFQCAMALEAAHRAGIVHRDIKPENIMLRPDGVVKIVDFGLARIGEAGQTSPQATQAGSIMGTPRYMSPEQARGEKLDGRSDIFSLGAVLYELFTGQRAFPGTSTAEVFAALLDSRPVAVGGRGLGAVLSKALAKDREARYRTMREFAEDLRRLDPHQSNGLLTAPANRNIRTLFGRHANKKWYLAAALAGIVAYTWIARRAPPPAGELQLLPLTTFAGSKDFPAFSPDGSRIAFSWKSAGDSAQHIYVKPVGEGEPVRLTFSRDDDIRPAWAPDGRSIAFARERTPGQIYRSHDIYIMSSQGGNERKIAEGCWLGASWSPDGKTVALAHVPRQSKGLAAGGIFLQSLESGKILELTSDHADHEPVFSPDGKRVAFVRNLIVGTASEVFLIPANGGKAKQLTFDRQPLNGITWTADGRELVFASRRSVADGSLWRFPIGGGRPRPVSATLRDAFHPNMSRQGWLAYTVDWLDTNIYLYTGRGWRNGAPGPFDPPAAVINSSWSDDSPSFSPDGERIAFVSNRSGTLEIWVSRRDGSGAVRLTSMDAVSTGSPRWSPDGHRITFDSWASGRSGIYVVDSGGGVPKLLSAEPGGSWLAAWSADGEWIYFNCGRSGQREIWRVPAAGGHPLQVTHGGAFRALPSPDGKLIYYMKPGAQPDCCAIWSVPAVGGAEKPVPGLESAVRQRFWGFWGVLDRGIYFMTVEASSEPMVRFLSFQTHRVTTLFTLPKPPYDARLTLPSTPGLVLSGDGHYALATQVEHAINDLMMITNFR